MFAWIRLSVVILFVVSMSVLAVLPLGERAESASRANVERDLQDDFRNREPIAAGPSSDNDPVDFSPAIRGERLPPTDVPISGDKYAAVQHRLQNLGVDYLVLERSPGSVPTYRFHCRIPVPDSSVYIRPFEATDEDPLRAMERVLFEVEGWYASRAPAGRVLR